MTTTEKTSFDTVTVNLLRYLGFDSVRDDYSGRGMYGKTCLAIVADDAWELQSALHEEFEVVKHDEDDYARLIKTLLQHKPEEDNMGMSKVFYWPGLTVEDD